MGDLVETLQSFQFSYLKLYVGIVIIIAKTLGIFV